MNNTLQTEARSTIREADFVSAWPSEVKQVLAKALKTEGDIPGYAVKQVRWAIKEAQRIERRFAKDIEVGEASLSHAEKRRRALSANRQHISPAVS